MYLILGRGVVTVISVAWGRRVNHKARSGGSLHSHDRQDSQFRTTSRGFVKKKSQVQPFGDSARQLQIDRGGEVGRIDLLEGQMLSAQTVRAVVQEALQQLQAHQLPQSVHLLGQGVRIRSCSLKCTNRMLHRSRTSGQIRARL